MIESPTVGATYWVVTPEVVRSGRGPVEIEVREVREAWGGGQKKPYSVTVRGNRGEYRVADLYTSADAVAVTLRLKSDIGEASRKAHETLESRLDEAYRRAVAIHEGAKP